MSCHPSDMQAAAAVATQLAAAHVRVLSIRAGLVPTVVVHPSRRLEELGVRGHRYAWGHDERGPYQRIQGRIGRTPIVWEVRL